MVCDAHASVGVVSCRDGVCPGYTLLSVSRTTYLIDKEGRVLHTWASRREVFVAYLLPSGNLLRDGSDLALAPQFVAGGASGYLEEVTWHNELVWSWSALPRFASLSHHDVAPLPNGNVLVLVWERKNKEQALAAGRHPELLPDGEVWDNCVVELRPDPASGRACEVHRWSQWDHLVQDFDPSKANYVEDVAAHPTKFDLNYAPPGGKAACRSGGLQPDEHPSVGPTGLEPQPGRLRIDLPLTRASSALDRASRCSTRLPGRRCACARHTCMACPCVPEEAATPSMCRRLQPCAFAWLRQRLQPCVVAGRARLAARQQRRLDLGARRRRLRARLVQRALRGRRGALAHGGRALSTPLL